MRLFKFTDRQFAKEATERGKIKIGTLHGYRDADTYSGDILDENEGISDRSISVDNFVGSPNNFNHSTGASIKGEGELRMYGSHFHSKVHTPNAYIFCLSTSFDETTRSWAAREEYNACYEIIDLASLIFAIQRQLAGDYTIMSGLCEYGNNHIQRPIDKGNGQQDILTALFLKDHRFRSQREYRIVFGPNKKMELQPTIIEDPEIAKCTRLI